MVSGNGRGSASKRKKKKVVRKKVAIKRKVPPQLKKYAFKKGNRANPGGRGKGVRNATNRLWAAIDVVEADLKKDLFEHLVKRAFSDDGVLKTLAGKLLPSGIEIVQETDGEVRVVFTDDGSNRL